MNNGLQKALNRTGIALLMLLSLALLGVPGVARAQTCSPTVMPLTAGLYSPEVVVGSVSVSNDSANMYVTVTLGGGAAFADTGSNNVFLWMGTDLSTVPRDTIAYPQAPQFPNKGVASTAAGAYTFTVPFLDLSIQDVGTACGRAVNVLLYADVVVDGNRKLAWAGNTQTIVNQYHWYYSGSHVVCCVVPPPVEQCDTAFGKGGWVWTTDPKSNPEKLPSLALTTNRWGWAINLTAPGSLTVPLYAGAGLNKVANGTLIGTVGISWNGAMATVTYNVTRGDLKETHVYVGSSSPTTIAPGQYGNTAYLASGATTQTVMAPAVNTGRGIWIVAHAVACNYK